METLWKVLGFVLGLFFLELCNGFPINLENSGPDSHTQFLTGLVAVLLTVCSVVLLAGCLCCQRRNGFKEFRDSPVVASVANSLDHGHVNPIANSEFTIFTPISPPHHNNNVFLANQRIVNRTQEDYRYGDIDVTYWFDGTEEDFPRTKLKYIRELGKGWFGRVVEGTAQGLNENPEEWCPVVVRILEASATSRERVLFLYDATIYRCGSHPNVLKVLGRSLDTIPLLLLQEYCAEGDLKRYLRSSKPAYEKFLSSDLPLLWCYQLTSAIKFLHDRRVTHPDLAARNCQVTNDMQLKLGDYGLGATLYPEDYYEGAPGVPLRWCAPETLSYTSTTIQSKQVTFEGNIWSLGVTMWEVCECGDQPYSWLTDDEVVTQVVETPKIRLPRSCFNTIYTDYLYRLMQSCWSTSESRPSASQIDLMLADLMQVYEHTKNIGHSEAYASMQDFDKRWESLKPNSVVKTDNEIIDMEGYTENDLTTLNALNLHVSNADEIRSNKKLSASLNNLHGSLDNLLEFRNNFDPMESWLENVASDTGDMSYVKGLSEAIKDLDNAIALENVSSDSSHQQSPIPDVIPKQNKLHFKLGRVSKPKFSEPPQNDSSQDSILYAQRTSSESETEEENWKRKIERGAYSEKVRQKSRSVADLMVLTHIDCSESDSETTLPSIDYKVKYGNARYIKNMENASLKFGSEGNLLNVHDTFQEELRRLQEERRDSLLFVPDKFSQSSSSISNISKANYDLPNLVSSVRNSPVKKLIQELNSSTEIVPSKQVYNIFNVSIEQTYSPIHTVPNVKENRGDTDLKSSDKCNQSEIKSNFRETCSKKSDNVDIRSETSCRDSHFSITDRESSVDNMKYVPLIEGNAGTQDREEGDSINSSDNRQLDVTSDCKVSNVDITEEGEIRIAEHKVCNAQYNVDRTADSDVERRESKARNTADSNIISKIEHRASLTEAEVCNNINTSENSSNESKEKGNKSYNAEINSSLTKKNNKTLRSHNKESDTSAEEVDSKKEATEEVNSSLGLNIATEELTIATERINTLEEEVETSANDVNTLTREVHSRGNQRETSLNISEKFRNFDVVRNSKAPEHLDIIERTYNRINQLTRLNHPDIIKTLITEEAAFNRDKSPFKEGEERHLLNNKELLERQSKNKNLIEKHLYDTKRESESEKNNHKKPKNCSADEDIINTLNNLDLKHEVPRLTDIIQNNIELLDYILVKNEFISGQTLRNVTEPQSHNRNGEDSNINCSRDYKNVDKHVCDFKTESFRSRDVSDVEEMRAGNDFTIQNCSSIEDNEDALYNSSSETHTSANGKINNSLQHLSSPVKYSLIDGEVADDAKHKEERYINSENKEDKADNVISESPSVADNKAIVEHEVIINKEYEEMYPRKEENKKLNKYLDSNFRIVSEVGSDDEINDVIPKPQTTDEETIIIENKVTTTEENEQVNKMLDLNHKETPKHTYDVALIGDNKNIGAICDVFFEKENNRERRLQGTNSLSQNELLPCRANTVEGDLISVSEETRYLNDNKDLNEESTNIEELASHISKNDLSSEVGNLDEYSAPSDTKCDIEAQSQARLEDTTSSDNQCKVLTDSHVDYVERRQFKTVLNENVADSDTITSNMEKFNILNEDEEKEKWLLINEENNKNSDEYIISDKADKYKEESLLSYTKEEDLLTLGNSRDKNEEAFPVMNEIFNQKLEDETSKAQEESLYSSAEEKSPEKSIASNKDKEEGAVANEERKQKSSEVNLYSRDSRFDETSKDEEKPIPLYIGEEINSLIPMKIVSVTSELSESTVNEERSETDVTEAALIEEKLCSKETKLNVLDAEESCIRTEELQPKLTACEERKSLDVTKSDVAREGTNQECSNSPTRQETESFELIGDEEILTVASPCSRRTISSNVLQEVADNKKLSELFIAQERKQEFDKDNVELEHATESDFLHLPVKEADEINAVANEVLRTLASQKKEEVDFGKPEQGNDMRKEVLRNEDTRPEPHTESRRENAEDREESTDPIINVDVTDVIKETLSNNDANLKHYENSHPQLNLTKSERKNEEKDAMREEDEELENQETDELGSLNCKTSLHFIGDHNNFEEKLHMIDRDAELEIQKLNTEININKDKGLSTSSEEIIEKLTEIIKAKKQKPEKEGHVNKEINADGVSSEEIKAEPHKQIDTEKSCTKTEELQPKFAVSEERTSLGVTKSDDAIEGTNQECSNPLIQQEIKSELTVDEEILNVASPCSEETISSSVLQEGADIKLLSELFINRERKQEFDKENVELEHATESDFLHLSAKEADEIVANEVLPALTAQKREEIDFGKPELGNDTRKELAGSFLNDASGIEHVPFKSYMSTEVDAEEPPIEVLKNGDTRPEPHTESKREDGEKSSDPIINVDVTNVIKETLSIRPENDNGANLNNDENSHPQLKLTKSEKRNDEKDVLNEEDNESDDQETDELGSLNCKTSLHFVGDHNNFEEKLHMIDRDAELEIEKLNTEININKDKGLSTSSEEIIEKLTEIIKAKKQKPEKKEHVNKEINADGVSTEEIEAEPRKQIDTEESCAKTEELQPKLAVCEERKSLGMTKSDVAREGTNQECSNSLTQQEIKSFELIGDEEILNVVGPCSGETISSSVLQEGADNKLLSELFINEERKQEFDKENVELEHATESDFVHLSAKGSDEKNVVIEEVLQTLTSQKKEGIDFGKPEQDNDLRKELTGFSSNEASGTEHVPFKSFMSTEVGAEEPPIEVLKNEDTRPEPHADGEKSLDPVMNVDVTNVIKETLSIRPENDNGANLKNDENSHPQLKLTKSEKKNDEKNVLNEEDIELNDQETDELGSLNCKTSLHFIGDHNNFEEKLHTIDRDAELDIQKLNTEININKDKGLSTSSEEIIEKLTEIIKAEKQKQVKKERVNKEINADGISSEAIKPETHEQVKVKNFSKRVNSEAVSSEDIKHEKQKQEEKELFNEKLKVKVVPSEESKAEKEEQMQKEHFNDDLKADVISSEEIEAGKQKQEKKIFIEEVNADIISSEELKAEKKEQVKHRHFNEDENASEEFKAEGQKLMKKEELTEEISTGAISLEENIDIRSLNITKNINSVKLSAKEKVVDVESIKLDFHSRAADTVSADQATPGSSNLDLGFCALVNDELTKEKNVEALENVHKSVEEINDKTEEAINVAVSEDVKISNKNRNEICVNSTQDFLDEEKLNYEDSRQPSKPQVKFDLSESQEEIAPNSLTHFSVFTSTPCLKRSLEATVILGASDDYSIDFYSGLKTSLDEAEDLQFSSNFTEDNSKAHVAQKLFDANKGHSPFKTPDPSDHSDLKYSLETWDNFLGKTFDDQESSRNVDFGNFSEEPQSLLFLDAANFDVKEKTADEKDRPLPDVNDGCRYKITKVLNETFTPNKEMSNKTFKVYEDVNEIDRKPNPMMSRTFNCDESAENVTFVKDSAVELNDITVTLTTAAAAESKHKQKDSDSSGIWEAGGGWFLHPQSHPEELSGQIVTSRSSGSDSYVGFSMDDEIMAAIRNELLSKLPHAQRASNEQVEDHEEIDPAEKNEVFVRYNVYSTPLSPIPEESYFDSDESGDVTPHRCDNSEDDSSDWSVQDNNSLNGDTETQSPRIMGSPLKGTLNRHTPSQESCCSNDTLFNVEELNAANDHDKAIDVRLGLDDTCEHENEQNELTLENAESRKSRGLLDETRMEQVQDSIGDILQIKHSAETEVNHVSTDVPTSEAERTLTYEMDGGDDIEQKEDIGEKSTLNKEEANFRGIVEVKQNIDSIKKEVLVNAGTCSTDINAKKEIVKDRSEQDLNAVFNVPKISVHNYVTDFLNNERYSQLNGNFESTGDNENEEVSTASDIYLTVSDNTFSFGQNVAPLNSPEDKPWKELQASFRRCEEADEMIEDKDILEALDESCESDEEGAEDFPENRIRLATEDFDNKGACMLREEIESDLPETVASVAARKEDDAVNSEIEEPLLLECKNDLDENKGELADFNAALVVNGTDFASSKRLKEDRDNGRNADVIPSISVTKVSQETENLEEAEKFVKGTDDLKRDIDCLREVRENSDNNIKEGDEVNKEIYDFLEKTDGIMKKIEAVTSKNADFSQISAIIRNTDAAEEGSNQSNEDIMKYGASETLNADEELQESENSSKSVKVVAKEIDERCGEIEKTDDLYDTEVTSKENDVTQKSGEVHKDINIIETVKKIQELTASTRIMETDEMEDSLEINLDNILDSKALLVDDKLKEINPDEATEADRCIEEKLYENLNSENEDYIRISDSLNSRNNQLRADDTPECDDHHISSKTDDILYENLHSAEDNQYETVGNSNRSDDADYVSLEHFESKANRTLLKTQENSGLADEAADSDYVRLKDDDKYVGNSEEEKFDRYEDMYGPLADIRFSGPANQLMTTSFSESTDLVDEQDWDSGSDTRSSSSGEFIWKEGEHEASVKALRAAPQSESFDDIVPMQEIREENESSCTSGSDGEEECPEFVPSAWDKYATPTKSALRSPEKSLERTVKEKKPKGVWFKKQKYHCVYEYPREPDSPLLQSYDLWQPTPDYHTLADWDLDPDPYLPTLDEPDFSTEYQPKNDKLPKNLYHLTTLPDLAIGTTMLDEDFFISSSSRPFDMLGGLTSQFFPGKQFSDNWNDNVTPDSGVEDITPASLSDNSEYGKLMQPSSQVQTLKSLAAEVANRNSNRSIELGGLRHTRNKLKLDLPPSPSAFTSSRSFTIEPAEEIVNRQVPTFTTFGKSRFLVQHVDTPPDDTVMKNVSFEALPYKPAKQYYKNDFDKERHKVEIVRGEASLLDSADEDSGIESCTLERKKTVDA